MRARACVCMCARACKRACGGGDTTHCNPDNVFIISVDKNNVIFL